MVNKQPLDLALVSQAVALCSLLLYVLGFVVVNAHLTKWDAASFNFANARYLAAGLLFAVFAASFWFLIGPRLQNLTSDFTKLSMLGHDYSWPRLWSFVCLIHVFAEFTFYHVLAASIAASLFFRGSTEQASLTGVLVALFLLDRYVLWNRKVYQRAPYLALPVASLAYVVAVAVAFTWFVDADMRSLLLVYFLSSLVLVFVFDINAHRETNTPFSAFWATLFVLGTAATFGSVSYGQIKSSVGGGEPRHVEVIFNADAPTSLTSKLVSSAGCAAPILMRAETSDSILLSAASGTGEIVLVSKSAIAGVVSCKRKGG